jgi:uncharacterized protein YutD
LEKSGETKKFSKQFNEVKDSYEFLIQNYDAYRARIQELFSDEEKKDKQKQVKRLRENIYLSN